MSFVAFLDRALAPSVTLVSESKTVAVTLSGRECLEDLLCYSESLGFECAEAAAKLYSENNPYAGMHGSMAADPIIEDEDHYEDARAMCIRIKKTFKGGSVAKSDEGNRKHQAWIKQCEAEARRPRMGHVGAKAAELDREFGR